MSENNVPMNEREWDGIVNTPERQEEADRRYAREQQIRAEKEEFLCNFYEKNEQRRMAMIEMRAIKYFLTAMVLGLAAYFLGETSLKWLAWTAGAFSVVFALITAYGLGMINEMKRR